MKLKSYALSISTHFMFFSSSFSVFGVSFAFSFCSEMFFSNSSLSVNIFGGALGR